MKKSHKTALVIGSVALLALAIGIAYRQYKKLMQYTIKVVQTKVKKLTMQEVAFDLYVQFTNQSDLTFTLARQQYDVFVNGKYVTRVFSDKPVVVKAKANTVIPVAVSFKPENVTKALGSNWAGLLLQPEKVKITTDISLNSTLWGIGVPVKAQYTVTMGELLKNPVA